MKTHTQQQAGNKSNFIIAALIIIGFLLHGELISSKTKSFSESPSITGPKEICDDQTATFQISTDDPKSTFKWMVDNEVRIVSGQGTSSIVIKTPRKFIDANLKVIIKNSAGIESIVATTISNGVPLKPEITGSSIICKTAHIYTFSCSKVSNATSYFWTITNNAKIISGQGTNEIKIDFTNSTSSTATVSVASIGKCDSSETTHKTLSISVSCRTLADTISSGDEGNVYDSFSVKDAPIKKNGEVGFFSKGEIVEIESYRKEAVKSMAASGASEVKSETPATPGSFENLLTGGEINDFSKWKLWENESKVILHRIADDYGLHTNVRHCINVLDQDGNAVIDATVTLSDKSGAIYTTKTDNTGIAECWSDGQPDLSAEIIYAGKNHSIKSIKSFDKGINTIFINRSCEVSDTVDLAFVVDATMSMSDEIDYLKSDMLGLINEIRTDKKLVIRIASVFYRDKNDKYQSEYSDFTTNIDDAIAYIKLHGADGGGDIPEMMERGMLDASRLSWSKHARSRIAFLIADAPPHNDEHSRTELQNAIRSCVEQGVRIVPVACSESSKPTELLMRNMALLSNGTYLYLTDKSGIGDSHIIPTTDKIDNKKLSRLLLSVMKRFTKAVECVQSTVEMPIDTTKDSTRINTSAIDTTKKDSLIIDQSIRDQIFDHPVDLENRLVIFPNPTAGKISLKSISTITIVYIFDFNGKILRRFDANSKEIPEIDLSEFANGEYIVKVDCGSKMACGKVMVQR